jgi:hypothetical protein
MAWAFFWLALAPFQKTADETIEDNKDGHHRQDILRGFSPRWDIPESHSDWHISSPS